MLFSPAKRGANRLYPHGHDCSCRVTGTGQAAQVNGHKTPPRPGRGPRPLLQPPLSFQPGQPPPLRPGKSCPDVAPLKGPALHNPPEQPWWLPPLWPLREPLVPPPGPFLNPPAHTCDDWTTSTLRTGTGGSHRRGELRLRHILPLTSHGPGDTLLHLETCIWSSGQREERTDTHLVGRFQE